MTDEKRIEALREFVAIVERLKYDYVAMLEKIKPLIESMDFCRKTVTMIPTQHSFYHRIDAAWGIIAMLYIDAIDEIATSDGLPEDEITALALSKTYDIMKRGK